MNKDQNGFGVMEIILLLALIGLVSCITYFAYTHHSALRKVDNPFTTPIAKLEPGAGDTQPNRKYRLGCNAQEIQVIVNFKSGVSEAEAKAIITKAGDTYLYTGGSANDPNYIVRSHVRDNGGDVNTIVQRVVSPYTALPKVDFAEVNSCEHIN